MDLFRDIDVLGRFPIETEYSKRRSQLLAEMILKSISSAVHLSQHLLFSELTQPLKRTQKVNKDLTPSGIQMLDRNKIP